MKTERKNKRKKQNGITLIGLVVTIIVLLILAGVSIATLTGENGILSQATKAKEQTESAKVIEEISIEYLKCKMEGNYSKENLQENLEGTIKFWNHDENNISYLVYETPDNKQYTLTIEKGTVKIIDDILNLWTEEEAQDWQWEELADGTIKITGYKGSSQTPVMPDAIDGKIITEIGYRAFYKNTLNDIILSKFLITIGERSFEYCANLKTIDIIEGVKHIGDYAFTWCGSLVKVTLPETLSTTGYGVFKYDGNITKIHYNSIHATLGEHNFVDAGKTEGEVELIIGAKVDTIPQRAFESSNITKIKIIEDNVKKIGDQLLISCSRLEEINFGNGIFDKVTNLNGSTFRGTGAKKIVIGENANINTLGFYEFANNLNCEILEWNSESMKVGPRMFGGIGKNVEKGTTVIFGNNVTKIPSNLFSYDITPPENPYNVTKVVILGNVTNVGVSAFCYANKLTDVYVYNNEILYNLTIEANNEYFQNATKWLYSEEPKGEGNYWHYDDNGNIVEW